MSESGQPGAATPGEHGDGTGPQDDLAHAGSGWAPPATGWARGAPAPGGWPRADLTTGWGASSPRHGDLPAPVPGLTAEEPPGRANGHHVNGVHHAGEEPPVTRQAPVSAPPADEPRRETGGDRLVVPAQRPAPAVEQPAAEADPGPSRHASDDPPAGRAARWADSGPISGPPALQVPPVGAAASGFEVPPGFHAPTADRSDAAPSLSRGWADRLPPEQPPTEPPPAAGRADHFPREQPPAEAPSLSRGWADRPTSAPPAGPDAGAAEERRPAAEQPRAAAGDRAAGEPPWSGPAWNRSSWGEGWAPPWAREDGPTGRPAGEEEPAGRRAAREDEPTGRRAAREEWAPEPVRPYEPARVEPPAGYEPPRPEPSRPYETPDTRPAPEPAAREFPDRPTWAGPPVPVTPFSAPPHTTPTSAPPVPHEAPSGPPPTSYPPAPPIRAAEEREARPYRLPGAAERSPAEPAGPPPAPVDRAPAPAPTSAPPYAARRSAPEPPPAAEAADLTPVLPQRVPAEPDVPVVPEPPAVEPPAETPELARIATHLRRDDEPAPLRERPEGFDVNAILDAVREVAGVRDAALRRTPAGAHSLRLDLADGADPAEVSRVVARLLQERMGLAAAPQNLPGAPSTPPPPVRRRSAQPRTDRPAEPRPAEDRPDPARSGPQSRPAEETPGPAWSAPQSRPAEDLPGPAWSAARSRPAGDVADPRSGPVEELTGPQSRPSDDPAGPRSGPNRPAENRSGEGRFTAPEARPGRLAEAPAEDADAGAEPPRRRRQAGGHRGRATVEESSLATAPAGTPTGSPATLGTSYSGGQMSTTETAPSRPLDTGGLPGPRVVIDHVQVSTFGLDATVEVRLIAGDHTAEGRSTGPAVDGYVLRLCAVAAAAAVDELLGQAAPAGERGRCFVEHTAVVPFGNCEVATVVVLLVCDGWVEQLAGSALVAGDPRQAVVRATLAAVNRRLEALLA
ncbi:hypothetical protein RMN56_14950 [Micromonospora halotolerans]|uniref:Uncharacterized protein n=1 Tax=Micromonospora halotolerans TaxID=709879 RepID=A0ABZ0A5V0_9ACTN|nr:hypothetical protein [Micromonospora halotolerans]WNM42552.1 hypothetical protein RMN56_14950 [Micromonospora halotolerans]